MRRAGVLLVLAGLTGLVVSGLVGGSRPAAAKGGLGSYSLTATAPGFEFTEDEPSAQAHPEGQGAVPETSTLLSAGPVCYALGTVAWPGSYGGNAGSLLQVLAPQEVTVPGGPSIPVPDAVQQAVYPNLSAANDPVRAEGRCGSAPDARYDAPGTNLTAHADPARSDAVGAVNGAEQPAQKTSYGSTRSHSTSQLVNGGTAGVSDALSAASNVDIGGVIKIGSITSTAHATTDEGVRRVTTVDGVQGVVNRDLNHRHRPAFHARVMTAGRENAQRSDIPIGDRIGHRIGQGRT